MATAIRSRRLVLISLIMIMLGWTSTAAQPLQSDFQMIHSAPGLSLHKEMFMLPVTFSDEYHGAQTEAVFQISAKHSIFDSRFYFAYTQISFWQAYDHKNSAPFRETNYNPELFYRFRTIPFHSGRLGADIGFEHESNGQRVPVSRSWNLAYFCPYYVQPNLLVYLKLRYRIPEEDKDYPLDPTGDDNPDITDYLGYGELRTAYKWRNNTFSLMLRNVLASGFERGSVEVAWSFPIWKYKFLKGYVQYFNGYGESLIDYNHYSNSIGIGVLVTDWL